jgi:hypothetical protein
MKVKFGLAILIVCLSITASFGQGRGQGRGPAGGPPAGIGNRPADHGPADHGTVNRRSEPNRGPESTSKPEGNSGRNDVSTRLNQNPALASRLQALLPAGTNIDTAANGFRNFGQFVAAAHVSQNLNIPFDQLKTRMVTDHKSLGQAIHELKPEVTTDAAKAEAKKAEDQAKEDTKKTS